MSIYPIKKFQLLLKIWKMKISSPKSKRHQKSTLFSTEKPPGE